jgi:hypothetical protein
VPHFLCKLTPPRKTFAADMTGEERACLLARQDYWRAKVDAGIVIAMGVVSDPAGDWGVAIVEAATVQQLRSWQRGDPAIRAERGFVYENFPMPSIRVAPIQPLASVFSVTP